MYVYLHTTVLFKKEKGCTTLKKGVILHSYTVLPPPPITATFLQQPLSFVPRVAVFEGFDSVQ